MKRLSPKALALIGVALMLVGAVATMVFAVSQTSCQNGGGLLPNPRLANHCSGVAWGARIGFVILALGALTVLLAGLRATPRYQRPPEPGPADAPSGSRAEEPLSDASVDQADRR